MTPRELATGLSKSPTVKDAIVLLVEAAELTGEERQGLLRIVGGYQEHLRRLHLSETAEHLLHAVESAIGTIFEARGDVL